VYGYHPAQSQGHIKRVAMAREVQNAIHNQRFRLGVIGAAGSPQSIPPVCASRIASAVSNL